MGNHSFILQIEIKNIGDQNFAELLVGIIIALRVLIIGAAHATPAE